MESKDVPDWYAVLGIKPDATKEQIRTAFKKRTIETHPDRHGNDPKKKDLFLSVRKAWEILSDEKAKAAFDAILKVRAARLVKDREMDSKRKSMKDDLIAREQAYKKQKTEEDRAKANFEAEMDRLRREGWRKVKEEEEERMSKAKVPATTFGVRPAPQMDTRDTSITVKWDRKKSSYDADRLRAIFSKFGEIAFIKAKSKSALIVFTKSSDAEEALAAVAVGEVGADLDVGWTEKEDKASSSSSSSSSLPPSFPFTHLPKTSASAAASSAPPNAPLPAHMRAEAHEDFEMAVLARMRSAAAKQQAPPPPPPPAASTETTS